MLYLTVNKNTSPVQNLQNLALVWFLVVVYWKLARADKLAGIVNFGKSNYTLYQNYTSHFAFIAKGAGPNYLDCSRRINLIFTTPYWLDSWFEIVNTKCVCAVLIRNDTIATLRLLYKGFHFHLTKTIDVQVIKNFIVLIHLLHV